MKIIIIGDSHIDIKNSILTEIIKSKGGLEFIDIKTIDNSTQNLEELVPRIHKIEPIKDEDLEDKTPFYAIKRKELQRKLARGKLKKL